MSDQQFKRNVAHKLKIGDLSLGKPIMNGEKFSFVELGDKKIVRVNIIGNIVDKYESGDERKFLFMTLDDGSGQIKLKTFGDDSDKFKDFYQGQTVVVIGVLRHWNDETYISPEVIRELNSKYLLLRKLETEKDKSLHPVPIDKEKVTAVKDKILDLVKDAEGEGGIDLDNLIMKLNDFPPQIINQETKKLLEEGIVFEPRPGRIRYLG